MNLEVLNHVSNSNGNIEDLIKLFVDSLDVAVSSRKTYVRSVRPVMAYLSNQRIHKPTPQDILGFKRHLESQGLSPSTIASYLTATKNLFKWLESQKLYEDISKSIKLPRPSRGLKRDPLTTEQVHKLLTSIDTSYTEGLRNYAIINLLIRTGLRTISLVTCDVGDLREVSGQTILDVRVKGSIEKDCYVILTPATLEPIKRYLGTRKNISNEQPLFTSLSDRCSNQRLSTRTISFIAKEALRKIGLDDSHHTAHGFRGTAITLALQNGASIQDVQSMSHHRDLNVLLHYMSNMNRRQNSAEKRIADLLAPASNSLGKKF